MRYILLFLFSFFSIGTSLLFFSALSYIRSEMKEQVIEDKSPQCMTFSKKNFADLRWDKKDKEFRLNGKMYDVSSVKIKNDKVLVYCIFDKDETNLRKNLADLFNDKPGNKSPLRLWVQILTQNYFAPVEFTLPSLQHNFVMIQNSYLFKIHTFENELEDPPPRG